MSSGVTLSELAGAVVSIAILSVMLLPVLSVVRDQTPELAPERWEETIAKFEERDRETPPPDSPLLFTGSSTVVQWKTVAEDMPFAPVINRGFGGSQVSDLLYYVDRVIIAYRPRMVVIYSGDNDISAGKDPALVLADYAAVEARIHAALPETTLVIVSVKPSVKRWHLAEPMLQLNALLPQWTAQRERTEYLSVWDEMLGEDGQPRPELYSDGLHMTPEGYRIWTEVMRPRLQALWEGEAQR